MSPQLLLGEKVDPAACDVYAMGILVWSMLSGGRHPYGHLKQEKKANRFGIMMRVAQGERPQLQVGWPAVFADMMQACWTKQPEERPSFVQLSRATEPHIK